MAQVTGSRAKTLVLVAMTLANGMVLIDQTAVPLASASAFGYSVTFLVTAALAVLGLVATTLLVRRPT